MNLLWSINERLGGNDGLTIPKPTHSWAGEICEMIRREFPKPIEDDVS